MKEHTALILKGQVVSEGSYNLASHDIRILTQNKCFWNSCTAAWLFKGELSSRHAELSSAMYSVRELS